MFRLEELGTGHFKRLVNTQHTGKMHKVGRGCGPAGNAHWQDAQGRGLILSIPDRADEMSWPTYLNSQRMIACTINDLSNQSKVTVTNNLLLLSSNFSSSVSFLTRRT